MPFKRNPIHAENIDSLARLLAALPRVAWDNAAHSLLERTLDDSANRRTILPEGFLIADELIARTSRLIAGLRVDRIAAERLLAAYGPFAATERLLMELARRGADRQTVHEIIREHSMTAWASGAGRRGEPARGSPVLGSSSDELCERPISWRRGSMRPSTWGMRPSVRGRWRRRSGQKLQGLRRHSARTGAIQNARRLATVRFY